MTNYEIYILVLCTIVFVMFTAVFSYMIATIAKQQIKLVKIGLEDDRIIKEYKKPKNKVWSVIDRVVSLLICIVFVAAFGFSLYMNSVEDKRPNGVPSLKVVKSDSMSYKNKDNVYLFENNLNDQIQTFDIIVTHHLPAEEDLKPYDVVVYKYGENYIVHRIIAIEEANETHPESRRFVFQGDAVGSPDSFMVTYEQMQGIYKGERIPFVGSFVLFLQSPAGWLCIILVIFTMFITPYLEKKVLREEKTRLEKLGISQTEN